MSIQTIDTWAQWQTRTPSGSRTVFAADADLLSLATTAPYEPTDADYADMEAHYDALPPEPDSFDGRCQGCGQNAFWNGRSYGDCLACVAESGADYD